MSARHVRDALSAKRRCDAPEKSERQWHDALRELAMA